MAAIALIFLLAALVPISIAMGLLMLTVRPLRPWAAYVYLPYPFAFGCAVLGGLLAGVVERMLEHYAGTTLESSTLAAVAIFVSIIGTVVLFAAAGALVAFAIGNRIWWRFFGPEEERGSKHGVLAITPPVLQILHSALEFGLNVFVLALEFLVNAFHAIRPSEKAQSKSSADR